MERVEIKDVRLPVQLQRAMAAEAEATREAKAKVRDKSQLPSLVGPYITYTQNPVQIRADHQPISEPVL